MICQLHGDTIIYKINNSQDIIISNIQVINSDSQFVYYKNKHSLNTNQLPCSQITQVTNESGDKIITSCSNKTDDINKRHHIKQKNGTLKKELIKEKKTEKLNKAEKTRVSTKKKEDIIPEKDYLNNLLLISLIIALIIINMKKKS
jgi:hypothetical protein